MVTKTLRGSYDAPRRSYAVSLENYMGDNEEMISDRQKKTLTSLIYSRIPDASECERRISQIEDLTSVEAEGEIFSFLSSQWQ